MISPKNHDTNRSKDVAGPELKRPEDKELSMKKDGMYDEVKVLSKHPLSELHHGDHTSPLTALGGQDVVVPSEMGKNSPDMKPSVQKGGLKDMQHHGGGRAPKGTGRSIAKELEYKAKRDTK